VLEQVDLSGVKILVLDHCVNDYQGGAPILDEANPASEYTYRGALRYALKTLRKNYPELRIVLVSAPNVAYWDKGAFATEVDYGCGTLDEYVETQKAVAEEYGVEWIDLFHELVPYGGEELTVDGVHPNETGREQIAEIIAEKLR
jgi:lysophospholipase L1-like esterase